MRVVGMAYAVSVAATGCAGPLGEGEAQFKKGHYPAAKQTLASVERESRAWDRHRRAEYALYRGLTLGALGDRARASSWLDQAKAIEDARPGSLADDDARRLATELDSNPLP